MISGRLRNTEYVINLKALRNNIQAQRAVMPAGSRVLAVVKANAYGHGLVPVAQAALRAGATGMCVAILDEALELRDSGVDAITLVLGITPVEEANVAAEAGVSLTVGSLEWLTKYHQFARQFNWKKPLKVHLAVDTGMGRIGFTNVAEFQQAATLLRQYPEFEFEGMFTHFATADSADSTYFDRQYARWQQFMNSLTELPPYVHMANSATGLWHRSQITANTIRMGISMFGYNPSGKELPVDLDLQPVGTLKTAICFIKKLAAGESVSYGATYTAAKDEWLATVPIGYADGYPRVITAEDMAEQAHTINYEILTNFNNRIHRTYHD